MDPTKHPNPSPEEGSLPWLTDSAVELVDTPPEPAIVSNSGYYTGTGVADDDPDVAWPPRRASARLPWLLVALLVVGAGAFALEVGVPAYQELTTLRTRVTDSNVALKAARQELDAAGELIASAAVARGKLELEIAALGADAKLRAARIEALEAAKVAMAERLGDRIQRGEVALAMDGDALVVTLADRALFSDPVTLGDDGKGLLGEVGAAVRPLGAVRIDAHYDRVVPSALRATFADTRALTAMRAATVARFLEDGAKIEAARLSAAGFGASGANGSKKARDRDRRVELRVEAPATE